MPPDPCQWITLQDALKTFVRDPSGTQTAEHIRSLHWYIASRLVVEGGFTPETIRPRPPFKVRKKQIAKKAAYILEHDPAAAGHGETAVFGGLKAKKIDVVMALPSIGPALAVSVKGTLRAFRNLMNRGEEAVGDCTNIHISYPTLVYGYFAAIRGNVEGPVPLDIDMDGDGHGFVLAADTALNDDGTATSMITRHHDTLVRLTGRQDLRDDVSRYEAVAFVLASTASESLGSPVASYPPPDSPLHLSRFFQTLYTRYDLRFVYATDEVSLKKITRRLMWHPSSPALQACAMDYEPRLSPPEGIAEPSEVGDGA